MSRAHDSTGPQDPRLQFAVMSLLLLVCPRSEGASHAFLSVPCPRTGHLKRVLLQSKSDVDSVGGACELFELLRSKPDTPASMFVDDHVVSSGNVLIAAPFDVLFLLLPLLSAAKCVTWADLLLSASSHPQLVHVLRSLEPKALSVLEMVCDTSTAGMFRLDNRKACAVLQKKVERLGILLHSKARSASARLRLGNSGGFSTSSVAVVSPDPPSTALDDSVTPEQHMTAALSCVSEYLSDAWVTELGHFCGFNRLGARTTEAELVQPSLGSASKAAQWNAAGLDDPAAIVSKYMRPSSAAGLGGDHDEADSSAGAGVKRKAAAAAASAPSAAQKRLVAVNKKGMQSMQSFFAPSGKSQ